MSKLFKLFTIVSIFLFLSSSVSALEVSIHNPSFESVKKSLWLSGLDSVVSASELAIIKGKSEVVEDTIEFPEELMRALQKKTSI